jgi:hypothetical protein
MISYICHNPECCKNGKEDFITSEQFYYHDGKLVGAHLNCPCCGKEREYINPAEDIPLSEKHQYIGRFTMASKEEQKEILKQRSHEHFKKEVQERKEHLMNRAMTEMKNLGK